MPKAIACTLRIAVPRISAIPKKSAANPFADLKVMQAALAHHTPPNTQTAGNLEIQKGKSSSSFLEFLVLGGCSISMEWPKLMELVEHVKIMVNLKYIVTK